MEKNCDEYHRVWMDRTDPSPILREISARVGYLEGEVSKIYWIFSPNVEIDPNFVSASNALYFMED
jgi:hypothetical protein